MTAPKIEVSFHVLEGPGALGVSPNFYVPQRMGD